MSSLKRSAFLYVRQSSLRQVFENSESTKRQYDLRQRAISLGWHLDQVIIIDSDQGQSGKSSADREGFQRLVTEVSLGHAGIVMGLEVSRLARNSSDWHRLLEICALTDTLVLDDDGLYNPAHFNDRLLLGLKGTMSEAELHVMRARRRDWARFGLLYLLDGVTENGRRILPEGWVDYSARFTPQSVDEHDFEYGAGFWTLRGNSAAARARIAAGMPPDSFMAIGAQGQYTIVMPSQELMIVRIRRMTTASRSSTWSERPSRRCNRKNDETPV
jgi:hypothetical protein